MTANASRDLPGLSRQVLYEFEMVEALAKRQVDLLMGGPRPEWQERFKTPDPLERAWFEVNALLESELLHVRALTAFLFRPAPMPEKRAGGKGRRKAGGLSDAFADDYFDDPIREWREHPDGRPRRPSLLTDLSLNRISREVAHVTYERAHFVDGGSMWNPYGLYSELAPVVEQFAKRADLGRLCKGFRERVNAAMPVRQPPPPTGPFRPGGVLPLVPTRAMPPR
jgi:hypothetical protein